MPQGKLLYSLPHGPVGTDKQAQGCTGEGLTPEGLSPRLRTRLLAVTCKISLLASIISGRLHMYFPQGTFRMLPLAPVRAGEGKTLRDLTPHLHSPVLVCLSQQAHAAASTTAFTVPTHVCASSWPRKHARELLCPYVCTLMCICTP